MRPIRTRNTNMTYKGPTPDIGDLPCERRKVDHDGSETDRIPTGIFAVYEFSQEERDLVAAGSNIELGVWYMEPIPPVSLTLTGEEEVTDADGIQVHNGGQQGG